VFVTAPNIIEQSDFSEGWSPSSQVVSMEPGALLDTKNLLIDAVTGSLYTRSGFRRIMEEVLGGSHYIQQVFDFKSRFSGVRHDYLICILSTGTSATNNVRLYAIDLSTLTASRIDTAGRTWTNYDKLHWGMEIQGTWYGGVQGEPMYSWDPSGPTWDAEASVKSSWKSWTNDTGASVNTNTEYGRDNAFKGTERVEHNGKYYVAKKSIRFPEWKTGQSYAAGERVSHKANGYWQSYKAKTESSGVEPPSNAHWKKIELSKPTDEDGDETQGDWDIVPLAAETSVAEWHANRLWLRYDGSGQRDRVQFSAPMRIQHGQEIGTLEFDPTDFVPGNDKRGPGGGWWNFNDGKHTGVVTALKSYGQYLLVFKRQSCWALSGQSETSFNSRRVARGLGTFSNESLAEHDGLVYFASEDGIYVTDATDVEEVPGLDKIRDWFKARMDLIIADGREDRYPRMWSMGPYVWVSLSRSGDPCTLVYHPETESFWYTNLPVMDMTLAHYDKTQRLYFVAHPSYGGDLVYQYNHASAPTHDDTGAGTQADADIAWHVRTSWWPFGLRREDRRIRRVWAVVKGVAQTFTITAYRNWTDTAAKTTARVSTTTTPQHVEGEWFPDAHAVSFKVAGTEGGSALYGIAVDTEPRRTRYHT
jgi:hypothetical protein